MASKLGKVKRKGVAKRVIPATPHKAKSRYQEQQVKLRMQSDTGDTDTRPIVASGGYTQFITASQEVILGNTGWQGDLNVVNDGNTATATSVNVTGTSKSLVVGGGLQERIPSDSLITTTLIRLYKFGSSTGGDLDVYLRLGGVRIGFDLANASTWNTTLGTPTYYQSAPVLTPEQWNDPTLEFEFTVSGFGTFNVAEIAMTCFYT